MSTLKKDLKNLSYKIEIKFTNCSTNFPHKEKIRKVCQSCINYKNCNSHLWFPRFSGFFSIAKIAIRSPMNGILKAIIN